MPKTVPASRGRVVMLTHAPFGPDSRVIKQVRSMSELGWDVVVLAAGNVAKDIDLHGGRVRVVKIEHSVIAQPANSRNPFPRSLFANQRSVRRAEHCVALHAARIDDLRYRVDSVRFTRPPLASARVAALRTRTLIAKGRKRVSTFRLKKTEEVVERRKEANSPIDRATLAFWQRVQGDRSWRRLWPAAWNQEQAYGPIIDRLKPDIIHANDFMMLAIGARAKLRAERAGRHPKLIWDAREYLPGMSPWTKHPRWKPAHVAMEREFAPYADAVVTVSEPLGDLLIRDHHLTERPAVVLNAPAVSDPPIQCPTDVRRECGLDDHTPLLVYSGAAMPQRGLEVMIEALPLLPGVHTAFVVLAPHHKKIPDYVLSIGERAEELGVGDRVHVLPYVGFDEVVSFLSTADVGVFPGLPFLNHTISLITKFLEYSHAHLPIAVSNLKFMAETVRETGQGEVFEPEDVPTYVEAIEKILANRSSYLAAYDDVERMKSWEWSRQAEVMDDLYTRLLTPRNVADHA